MTNNLPEFSYNIYTVTLGGYLNDVRRIVYAGHYKCVGERLGREALAEDPVACGYLVATWQSGKIILEEWQGRHTEENPLEYVDRTVMYSEPLKKVVWGVIDDKADYSTP